MISQIAGLLQMHMHHVPGFRSTRDSQPAYAFVQRMALGLAAHPEARSSDPGCSAALAAASPDAHGRSHVNIGSQGKSAKHVDLAQGTI